MVEFLNGTLREYVVLNDGAIGVVLPLQAAVLPRRADLNILVVDRIAAI
jgi:hypothetical protein